MFGAKRQNADGGDSAALEYLQDVPGSRIGGVFTKYTQ
jgi:hypothetical protein